VQKAIILKYHKRDHIYLW